MVKGLIVSLLIFSLLFSQPLVWGGFSYAQEMPSYWQERLSSQREEWESSLQPVNDVEPSPTPTPDTNPEPTPQPSDDVQPNEAQPVEEQIESADLVEEPPNDPINEDTGPLSENIASYEEEEKISIFNANNAWIENKIDSFVNTGWNKANYNTGHGAITTGQAYAWASVQTKANTNSTWLPDSFQDGSTNPAVVQNEETGPESSNLAEAEILNEVEIINENNFENTNEIGILSNTGANEAMYNTGDGMIDSGDAQAVVDLVVNANSNFVNSDDSLMGSFSLFGENIGDLDFSNFGQTPVFENNDQIPSDGFVEENLSVFETDSPVLASNTTTGPDSENYAILEATSSATIINDNLAVVENDVFVAATTGDNISSYNTGDGVVESGDADLIANVVNFINSNIVNSEVILATINVFGQWIGDLILPSLGLEENSSGKATIVNSNENTGPDSLNEATTSIDSEFEVINENEGLIINDFQPEANTGENLAEHNTGGGAIETGEVSAQGSITSLANQNITNANPIILIINTLGEWVGEIISPDGTVSHQEGEQDVLVYSTFGGESVNFATGPNSENIAETNIEENTLIENTNDFVVKNNVSLLADTGGNEASCNTGQGVIKSGEANLAANLVNFANTNITEAKVIIAVINVFGEWLGNILAPKNPEDNSETDFPELDESSSQDFDDDNPVESSDSQVEPSFPQEEFSQDETPQEIPSQDDVPPPDNNDEEPNFFGFMTDDTDSGSDFSGGAEASSSQEDSSSVLGAKLFFDPYGFSTSLGNFLAASPQVLKMLGEKGVSLFANFVPKLSLISLIVIIVTSIISFLKIPVFG